MKPLILALVLPLLLPAEIKLPAIFADHMVLQRNVPVPIWGTADPGEKVTIEFNGQTKTATAAPDGKWLLRLDPLKTAAEPQDLKAGPIIIQDVLVGEVWLAGGQSNMAFGLNAAHNAAEALPQASDPQLRFFTVTHNTSPDPLPDLKGKWELTTPASAKGFSAVAYFFARELRRTQNCPIAILHSSWGGTPIETWIGLDAFKREPPLVKPLQQWDKALAQYRKLQADPQPSVAYTAELKRWRKEVEPTFNAATKAYNAAGGQGEKPKPAWPEPVNPDPMTIPSPSARPQTPSISFNAMIAPLVPYALRGALWYQGEANGSAGVDYRALLPRLIRDWRTRWNNQFPFLIVQLPCNGKDVAPVAPNGWPWLREAQAMTLREPHTSMAVTIDIGDPNNVHPTDKIDVGQRLALLARRDVYGEELIATGPLYRNSSIEGNRIRLNFTDTGTGLTPGQAPWRAPGVEPMPTNKLIGFFIAGQDHQWMEAEAKIEGDAVVVSSPAVVQPVAVRYGWANSPRCNLYNREGLPAGPFRTDSWN